MVFPLPINKHSNYMFIADVLAAIYKRRLFLHLNQANKEKE